MKEMKTPMNVVEIHGLAVHAAGAQLVPYRYEPGELQANEVEVKISHCGVCRSDIHLIDNDWGNSKYPFIPGHEIVGTVSAVGEGVKDRKVGERVGIGWQADSCGICEWCRQGDEHLCANSQGVCVGRNGGYADAVRVNSRFAIPVPETLESENVAPLLCGGITVYSPMRKHGIGPFSRVGVVGIGGLGHLGLQFAKAFGAEVTALSTSKDKEAEALELGATSFVNTRDAAELKKIAGSFDFLLSTVSADQDWQALVNSLRPKGDALHRRRAAVADLAAGVSTDLGTTVGCWEPDRQSAGPARDAGRGGTAWSEGDYGALRDGEGERRDCQGEEGQGSVSGGAGELGQSQPRICTDKRGSSAGRGFGLRLFSLERK